MRNILKRYHYYYYFVIFIGFLNICYLINTDSKKIKGSTYGESTCNLFTNKKNFIIRLNGIRYPKIVPL
jgi:hypothetical protein